jgi:hypothetical protein
MGHAQTDSSKSEGTGNGSTAEKQKEAVDALLGSSDTSHTKSRNTESTGTSKSTKGTKSEAQPKASTEEQSPRSGPNRTGSGTSTHHGAPAGVVPEVPAASDLGLSTDTTPSTAPVTPTPPPPPPSTPPVTAPTVPVTPPPVDYHSPSTAPPAPPATSESANATASQNPPAPGGASAGTAIIIGLIVLAVLLVALAAVVGVMAAQRARAVEHIPVAPTAGPGVPPGWAYLSAPEAPNITIHKSPFIMGSAPNCDLRLADPKASPQHARIEHTPDGYVLIDMNSLNGTYLNGERIASPVTLRPGDQIRMGDIVVTFEIYTG